MAIQLLPLEALYTTGATLYAIIHGVVGGVRKVWNTTLNTGAGGWEVFNSANWAQYVVALTEQGSSGYYAASYPVNISGVLTSEVFYVQAGGSPATSDTPGAGLAHSQGQNMTGVAADVDASINLQKAVISEQRGAAAGTPTVSVIPTDLASTQPNAYAGRAVIFTSGAAFQCAGRIVAYAVTDGVLTLAAPLPVAPAAADTFIIV